VFVCVCVCVCVCVRVRVCVRVCVCVRNRPSSKVECKDTKIRVSVVKLFFWTLILASFLFASVLLFLVYILAFLFIFLLSCLLVLLACLLVNAGIQRVLVVG
jgi:cellulose synthase/poly-beta-1,6-N-acetylglucosamine synthase-like glycosyltransferase